MAKSYRALRSFDVGGDELTHYDTGDAFPAASPHLDGLVREGYVGDGTAAGGATEPAAQEAAKSPAKSAAKRSGSRSSR